MRRALIVLAVVMVLVIGSAMPAFAGSAGSEFGGHHAQMAQDMGGFTAEMNPGMHQGFAGWTGP